jgi:hypothetical protein
MRVPSREARYGAFGVLTGVAAVAAGRCGGASCLSCLACAVPGAAVVLLAALGARRVPRRGREPATIAERDRRAGPERARSAGIRDG